MVNVVVLAGTVAADPVQRRMPSGDEVGQPRLSELSRWRLFRKRI
jgi:single-stranded DNA-binding protein